MHAARVLSNLTWYPADPLISLRWAFGHFSHGSLHSRSEGGEGQTMGWEAPFKNGKQEEIARSSHGRRGQRLGPRHGSSGVRGGRQPEPPRERRLGAAELDSADAELQLASLFASEPD